jgi:hypothetical protein
VCHLIGQNYWPWQNLTPEWDSSDAVKPVGQKSLWICSYENSRRTGFSDAARNVKFLKGRKGRKMVEMKGSDKYYSIMLLPFRSFDLVLCIIGQLVSTVLVTLYANIATD